MCVTHGMPCVNMHGSFEAYRRGFTWAVGEARRAQFQFVGGASRRRRRSKGEEKGRKRKEKERRKEKKKGEEERKKKEEKEGVLRSEQTWTEKNPELSYKR